MESRVRSDEGSRRTAPSIGRGPRSRLPGVLVVLSVLRQGARGLAGQGGHARADLRRGALPHEPEQPGEEVGVSLGDPRLPRSWMKDASSVFTYWMARPDALDRAAAASA